jgi:hypothetical protein
MAVLLAGERPRVDYWVSLVIGLAAVVGLSIVQGAGHLRGGDLLLLEERTL